MFARPAAWRRGIAISKMVRKPRKETPFEGYVTAMHSRKEAAFSDTTAALSITRNPFRTSTNSISLHLTFLCPPCPTRPLCSFYSRGVRERRQSYCCGSSDSWISWKCLDHLRAGPSSRARPTSARLEEGWDLCVLPWESPRHCAWTHVKVQSRGYSRGT